MKIELLVSIANNDRVDIVVSTAGDDDGDDENTSSIAEGGSSEITVAFD